MVKHWPTLIFVDGDGDLVRCDCGEQGFDFAGGKEWFARHIIELMGCDNCVGCREHTCNDHEKEALPLQNRAS